MKQEFNDVFLRDENGNKRGKLYVAFSNIVESDWLKITANIETDKSLLDGIKTNMTLTCASSNNKSKVLSVNEAEIVLETPMFTANESLLKKGEIILIQDESYYENFW